MNSLRLQRKAAGQSSMFSVRCSDDSAGIARSLSSNAFILASSSSVSESEYAEVGRRDLSGRGGSWRGVVLKYHSESNKTDSLTPAARASFANATIDTLNSPRSSPETYDRSRPAARARPSWESPFA